MTEHVNYIEVRLGEVYVKVILNSETAVRNALTADNWAQVGDRFRLALARRDARAADRIAD
jgi:hypothetical protein